jgi:uncharacterized Zn-binding protein involved in type VI secretion
MVTGVVPHVGGPILPPGCPTVMIGMMPAARMTDMATCVGPPDVIAKGSPTVLIGNLMAARMGDLTAHGGTIVIGLPTVMIGEVGLGAIALAVNPTNSVVNCGNIIDAVVARLTGTNPNATAPAGRDGSWAQIDARMGTTIQWGHSFQDAFDAVQKGGDGTIAVIGIKYGSGTASHVVIMTNANGQATIVEGQDWGTGNPKEADSSVAQANARYNNDGKTDVGIGIIRTGSGP